MAHLRPKSATAETLTMDTGSLEPLKLREAGGNNKARRAEHYKCDVLTAVRDEGEIRLLCVTRQMSHIIAN